MEERGTVIDCAGGMARVLIERSEACEGCTFCALSETGDHMIASAVDRLGVSPGDRVRIETRGPAPVPAALLLFLVPLAFLFGGYGAGALIANALRVPGAGQAAGAAGAVVFFAASFALLSLATRRRLAGRDGKAPSVIVEKLP